MNRRRRQLLSSSAVAMMLVLFGIGLATESPTEPAAILYAVPVVLIAIAFGPVAGATVGALAALLFWVAAHYQAEGLDTVQIAYRLAVLVFLGVAAGGAATRLETSGEREREARELAERAAERLEEAQRTAHLGSWEWDVAADAIEWSDELYRIYGVSRESFETTYESYLALLHPDDRGFVEAAVRHAFETHEPFAFSHRLLRQDGAVRVVESTGKVTVENGQVARMAGTALDVTERRAFEVEAAFARERLLLREERGQRAVELNDEVVQGLALSSYLFSAGDTPAGTAALRATLERAKQLVGDLIETDSLEPGGLRRERPAEVE